MGYANGYEHLVPLGGCQTIDHVHNVGTVKNGRVDLGYFVIVKDQRY